jgi:Restriction endonuclease
MLKRYRLNLGSFVMSKGKDYEIEVASLVQKMVDEGELGIMPELAKIKRKPSYYSRDRQKDIIFDVSIEVSRKNAPEPYWIWIWECKNYSHKVPVDDIEEFHAKINQVGADRTKGAMITPIGFDSGALEFATSKGIGLWRWVPWDSPVSIRDSVDFIDDETNEMVIRGLTISDTRKLSSNYFYGLTSDGIFTTNKLKLIAQEFSDM